VPAHLRSISDVSGAGDTVISVATLCLSLGLDAESIISFSNLAGGIVCESVGVVPIGKERFYKELESINKT
jgi:bifunctional ADP-heptose synthase (sugar kinase/adenylyltransferase)